MENCDIHGKESKRSFVPKDTRPHGGFVGLRHFLSLVVQPGSYTLACTNTSQVSFSPFYLGEVDFELDMRSKG